LSATAATTASRKAAWCDDRRAVPTSRGPTPREARSSAVVHRRSSHGPITECLC
jgi:hypothetical protein